MTFFDSYEEQAAYDRGVADQRARQAKEEEKRNSSNCWSQYLKTNPPMKAWAEANATMAEKTKQKYDDC